MDKDEGRVRDRVRLVGLIEEECNLPSISMLEDRVYIMDGHGLTIHEAPGCMRYLFVELLR